MISSTCSGQGIQMMPRLPLIGMIKESTLQAILIQWPWGGCKSQQTKTSTSGLVMSGQAITSKLKDAKWRETAIIVKTLYAGTEQQLCRELILQTSAFSSSMLQWRPHQMEELAPMMSNNRNKGISWDWIAMPAQMPQIATKMWPKFKFSTA